MIIVKLKKIKEIRYVIKVRALGKRLCQSDKES